MLLLMMCNALSVFNVWKYVAQMPDLVRLCMNLQTRPLWSLWLLMFE